MYEGTTAPRPIGQRARPTRSSTRDHGRTTRRVIAAPLAAALLTLALVACTPPHDTAGATGAWESSLAAIGDRYEFVLDGESLTGEAYYPYFVDFVAAGREHVGSLTGTVDAAGNAAWVVTLDENGWSGTEVSTGRFVGGRFDGTWELFDLGGTPFRSGPHALLKKAF
jgi:hypothetical protein